MRHVALIVLWIHVLTILRQARPSSIPASALMGKYPQDLAESWDSDRRGAQTGEFCGQWGLGNALIG